MTAPVVLDNGVLRVTVDPLVGGTITRVERSAGGVSVLGQVPWRGLRKPLPRGASSEAEWLTRYSGGWPLMFPNGGEACMLDGTVHGFHGEASVSPWRCEARAPGLRLVRDFETVPVRMTRDVMLDGDVLRVNERAEATGTVPVPVIWGQHVTFGSDLLAGDVVVETGARRVRVDRDYDPPSNPWQPGATGLWPDVPGKAGPADPAHPQAPQASLAYLSDFAAPFAAIRRLDGTVAAVLSWEGEVFDCLWYWCELAGTGDAPWSGQGRVIGLEPCSTPYGGGLAEAVRRGFRVIRLVPGQPVEAMVRLQVTAASGFILGVDPDGRALS